MSETDFLATLPIERRLALSYAPARSRSVWLGLFALDARLSGIVRDAREPMLAQIKLAWWRDELAKPAELRRRGEPLLALLEPWGDRAHGLASLTETWEPLLGDERLTRQDAAAAAEGRAAACLALADILEVSPDGIAEAARGWALADLAPMLAEPPVHDWRSARLPREFRPLQVLFGLAARRKGQSPLLAGPIAALVAVRLGLLGI
jgi:phytoene synthase